MPHTCEDCGETFDTLSRLRLHDCPDDTGDDELFEEKMAEVKQQQRKTQRDVQRVASDNLTDAIDQAQQGSEMAIYRALAQYERHLAEEWAKGEDGLYWGFHREFHGPAVEGLETVAQRDGWGFLLEVLEAYWPDATYDFETYPDHESFDRAERGEYEEYPHVSHVLATVTGKQLVRTRRTNGVAAIPADALDYLLEFHRHPGDTHPWIDSMSYGWGIGHPERPFADTIETLVEGEYEIWAGTAIEHAFHADQHAATDLVEDVFAAGIVSDPAQILNALGRIDDGYPPDTSDHWDWVTLYPEFHEDGFDWDPTVRDRLRAVVVDSGLARQLPADWEFTDIVL